jgi:hypothetical protein
MISCREFRDAFAPSTTDARLMEHVRSCDACLDFAAHVDPDIMFRAIGGSDMIPPGGLDAFVDDVMRQVRVRSAANVVTMQNHWPWRRLSAAAAIVVGITAGALVYERGHVGVTPVVLPVRQQASIVKNLTTKPVVETYESENATIVEVPQKGESTGADVVMIIDDSLPSDL